MNISQFDIWQVNLNPTIGSEQNGRRHCIILQTNAASNYGLTTIIAPITSKKIEKVYPFEIKINPSNKNGLKELSKIKFDQVRVIDKRRLIEKFGKIEDRYFIEILKALKIIFDFDRDFNVV
ncbi:MAG: type II toxin-antitoxin system PemK/MazF family toxin [Patescibacteria group bacterium]|nr:type II toxin-antitoxin system PemK/MazF family toxin [Patescibacteria group bacterium]